MTVDGKTPLKAAMSLAAHARLAYHPAAIVMREMRPVLETRAGQTGKLPNQTCGSATATGSICGGEGENVTSVGLLAWLFVTAVGLQERKPHHPPQPILDVFGCHSLVVSLNPLHCPIHRYLGTYRSPLPR